MLLNDGGTSFLGRVPGRGPIYYGFIVAGKSDARLDNQRFGLEHLAISATTATCFPALAFGEKESGRYAQVKTYEGDTLIDTDTYTWSSWGETHPTDPTRRIWYLNASGGQRKWAVGYRVVAPVTPGAFASYYQVAWGAGISCDVPMVSNTIGMTGVSYDIPSRTSNYSTAAAAVDTPGGWFSDSGSGAIIDYIPENEVHLTRSELLSDKVRRRDVVVGAIVGDPLRKVP